MDFSEKATTKAALDLFNDAAETESEEVSTVAELDGVTERVAEILKANGIEDIVQFIEAYNNESVQKIDSLTKEEVEAVYNIIKETVDIVEEESGESAEELVEEEKYYCPECGAEITLDMVRCPKCGVEFEFTEDEE